MNNLELYIPELDELIFRQKLLSDPETMSYNAPWFPPDGCINFPESEWSNWYNKWIGQEAKRFYAYLRRIKDSSFVGEVNFYYNAHADWWDMGIVIVASERGKGYGKEGMSLLLDRAFNVNGISRLHNCFEKSRHAAYKIHKEVGFKDIDVQEMAVQEKNLHHLILTKEDYLKRVGCD